MPRSRTRSGHRTLPDLALDHTRCWFITMQMDPADWYSPPMRRELARVWLIAR